VPTHEGQYKSNNSYFLFSETIIRVMMKFTYIMGMSLTKLQLFFHKLSFSTFAWEAVCWLHKTLCWSV